MPTRAASVLAAAGVLYGVAVIAAARPWGGRSWASTPLLLLGDAVGLVVLLGIVSGVYRPCPACIVVWSAVLLAGLGILTSGGREARALTAALIVFTLAAAWTRLDRTTAAGIAELLPRKGVSADCLADVLNSRNLADLKQLGMPDGEPVIFVAHCSPCAAAQVARVEGKAPGFKVVASDSTLGPVVGSDRLIVYPNLKILAAKLHANLYTLTVKGGSVTQCSTNINENF